jgi:uncharacterized membrane protein
VNTTLMILAILTVFLLAAIAGGVWFVALQVMGVAESLERIDTRGLPTFTHPPGPRPIDMIHSEN